MELLRHTVAMLGVLIVAACSGLSSQSNTASIQQGPASSKSSVSPEPSTIRSGKPDIRSIDFEKVGYPNLPDYSDDRVKRRRNLKPGEGKPHELVFGDVNNDGYEDAIAVLGIDSRGSATPEYVYVFTLENGKLKLIWDFETGDRADGGLKKIYAENGNLTVELYGRNRYIGAQFYGGDEPLCCPTWFTRSTYRWNGRQFEIVAKDTIPLNSSNDSN
jgi:hypothetical protein